MRTLLVENDGEWRGWEWRSVGSGRGCLSVGFVRFEHLETRENRLRCDVDRVLIPSYISPLV